jgi:hypothetical protein
MSLSGLNLQLCPTWERFGGRLIRGDLKLTGGEERDPFLDIELVSCDYYVRILLPCWLVHFLKLMCAKESGSLL